MEKTAILRKWIQNARRAVFFGGAGVSTESGIPDFRSENGLYRQKFAYPPEYMLSRTFFDTHPEEFFEFYRAKMLAPTALPNAAHRKIAEWEKAGKFAAVVTQNIDGLHRKAGSRTVYELHGSVYRNHCLSCGKFYGLEKILQTSGVPRCVCGGVIKPDVVLYEEPLPEDAWEGAVRAISEADLLVVAGTSLTVYPAAYLVRYFHGAHSVSIDISPRAEGVCEMHITGKIGETLAAIEI